MAPAGPAMASADDVTYPSGLKLVLLMLSIFTGMFLVSLDKLIISTAIPRITNEFNSAGDIGWYGTAYLLTNCAFQLVFGKVYTLLNVKATFLTSIILFEAGSALCGGAPNSVAFIFGRAIAGVGAGGVLSGVIVIMVHTVPLHKRPKYQGFFGAVFGISSVLGPLVGGAFTTKVTWRWCFYINLPLGGVVAAMIFFLLHIPNRSIPNMTLKNKLRQLNALGLLALLPGIVCLCLALQWGGTKYAWSEGRVIALLVLAFALLIVFCFIQVWKPEQATLPPRIFIQRSIASGFWISCCIGAHQTLFIYYLPIYFQTIQHASALQSGIHLFPTVLPIVLSSILTGQLVSRIGYYTPPLLFGISLTAVGAGLLTTLSPTTSVAQWTSYQLIYGLGLGACSQAPNTAAQTVLPKPDVSIGASLMFFGQTLFGAVFTSVGQNVLDNQLARRLVHIPGLSPDMLQRTGATEVLNRVPRRYYAVALDAYSASLRTCFRVGLIMACISVVGAAVMEWKSVKKRESASARDADGAQAAADEAQGGGEFSEEGDKRTTSPVDEDTATSRTDPAVGGRDD